MPRSVGTGSRKGHGTGRWESADQAEGGRLLGRVGPQLFSPAVPAPPPKE